jgi:S-(hydroxymethyl)glutathione dehydrogenase/alcohol dehydrogenase
MIGVVKAAVCHAFGEPLTLVDVELESPGDDEVMVKVEACSICRSDISYLDGLWGGRLPAVFGHEVAGTIEQLGAGVEDVRRGDPVVVTIVRHCGRCHFCARGQPALCDTSFALDRRSPLRLNGESVSQGLRVAGFAERVVVHSSQVIPLDAAVPFTSAAFVGCAVATGFGAVVRDADVRAGSSVVVVGAGGVGVNSIQAAALVGAHPIVAIEVSEQKLSAAGMFGATHTVDPSRADVAGAVRDVTGGRGADAVVVTVGDAQVIEAGIRLARRGGTVVVVGMPPSGVTVGLDLGELAHDGRRVVGSKLGSVRPAEDLPRLISLYRDGRWRLDELESGRFSLDQINEAVDHARRGETLRTLIVF